jgi:prephenate dehydrogenase
MDATEKLAQMMIRCGLATGHGDTIDDLIFELEKQIKNTRLANSDLQMWYDYAKTECDKMREELKELRLSYEVVVAALKEKE